MQITAFHNLTHIYNDTLIHCGQRWPVVCRRRSITVQNARDRHSPTHTCGCQRWFWHRGSQYLAHLLGKTPVVSLTNKKFQVNLCKLDSEGLKAGAHIFEKNIFTLQNIVCYSWWHGASSGAMPSAVTKNISCKSNFTIFCRKENPISTPETRAW